MIKAKASDIIWSYLGIILNIASQIIWLPVLLYYVDSDELAIWYIFASIGGIAMLLDMGFSSQISRAVAYAWTGADRLRKTGVNTVKPSVKESNIALLKAVKKSCNIIYSIISFLALICMSVLGTYYLIWIIGIDSVYTMISWGIYAVATFLNIYIGYYAVMLRGIGDIECYNRANIISKLLMMIVGYLLLINGMGILGLSIAYFVSGLAQRFISRYYLTKKHNLFEKFKEIIDKKIYNSKEILFTLWHNAWRDGLVTTALYITTGATVLLSGAFLTLEETALYSVSLHIVNAIVMIARGMSSGYMPSVQSAFVENNIGVIREFIGRSVTAYYTVCVIGVIIFITVGIPVIQWIKPTFKIDIYVFLILSIHIIMMDRHRLSAAFISARNVLPYTKAFIISAILCVIVSYITMRYGDMGVYGIIAGPMVIQCCYNNWKWNTELNRMIDSSEVDLIKSGMRCLVNNIRKEFDIIKRKM